MSTHQESHTVNQPTLAEQQAADFQNAKHSRNGQPSVFGKRLYWGYYRAVTVHFSIPKKAEIAVGV